MITTIINSLKGKKAYIVGVLMTVLGVMQGDTAMTLQGLSVIALRAGISKK